MSEDFNMKPAEQISTEASRTVVIYVDTDRANEILQIFEVPMPDADDLDEIKLVIDKSKRRLAINENAS